MAAFFYHLLSRKSCFFFISFFTPKYLSYMLLESLLYMFVCLFFYLGKMSLLKLKKSVATLVRRSLLSHTLSNQDLKTLLVRLVVSSLIMLPRQPLPQLLLQSRLLWLLYAQVLPDSSFAAPVVKKMFTGFTQLSSSLSQTELLLSILIFCLTSKLSAKPLAFEIYAK